MLNTSSEIVCWSCAYVFLGSPARVNLSQACEAHTNLAVIANMSQHMLISTYRQALQTLTGLARLCHVAICILEQVAWLLQVIGRRTGCSQCFSPTLQLVDPRAAKYPRRSHTATSAAFVAPRSCCADSEKATRIAWESLLLLHTIPLLVKLDENGGKTDISYWTRIRNPCARGSHSIAAISEPGNPTLPVPCSPLASKSKGP